MILMNPCWSGSFIFNDTISTTNVYNYNIRTRAQNANWDGVSPLIANITVTGTGIIGSNSVSSPAFDTDLGFPTGSILTLNILSGGYISGKGGNGGNGTGGTGQNGETGGVGLKVRTAITVNNLGTIQGGGGGGGGGGAGWGGGDGGAGWNPGSGGASGGNAPPEGASGVSGALTYASNSASYGGGGGNPGQAGTVAATINPGSGGGGGNAIEGNSLITWTNTGTRLVNIVA